MPRGGAGACTKIRCSYAIETARATHAPRTPFVPHTGSPLSREFMCESSSDASEITALYTFYKMSCAVYEMRRVCGVWL